MPTLSRYFIKAGLLYFVAAVMVGVLLAATSVVRLPGWVAALRPVFYHLFMVGWVTQIIIGVAYWMFPKQSKERPRGNEKLGWAVFILLNAGLLLRVMGEPLVTAEPDLRLGWVLALSAVLQVLAGWGFIVNTWSRVKER